MIRTELLRIRDGGGFAWRSVPPDGNSPVHGPFSSECAAVKHLLGEVGDQLDEEGLAAIAAAIPSFLEFWRAYLQGLAFTANDESTGSPEPAWLCDGEDIDPDHISKNLDAPDRKELLEDCLNFWIEAHEKVAANPKQAGYDFHLTRNGHGSGFWDGGWPAKDGRELTTLAKTFGPAELSLCDETWTIFH